MKESTIGEAFAVDGVLKTCGDKFGLWGGGGFWSAIAEIRETQLLKTLSNTVILELML